MKRYGTLLTLMLVMLLLGISTPADAQFWKKIFGKKEPVRRSAPRPHPATKPAPPPKKTTTSRRKTRSELLDYPRSQVKDRYRIDVLIPLYLNDLVKNGKPVGKDRAPDKASKAAPGIAFYEGIRLAADTLEKYGYHMDIWVHDITDPLESAETLLHTNALESSDLIIGAVGSEQVAPIAQYAKRKEINFISAFSTSDANIKDNYYLTLLQPTLQTHCEWLRKSIARKYSSTRLLVYRRPSVPRDELAFQILTRDGGFDYTELKVETAPAMEDLRKLLDSSKINVVAMPIVDQGDAEDLVVQLSKSFPQYQFEVYGMPSWKVMPILRKANALSNMALYITAPFYFDPSTASGQQLAAQYKRTFGGKPGEMVYRGYETLHWYAYLLNRYGNIFNDKMDDNGAATFTRFNIQPRWDRDDNLLYNENEHVYLYRYQGGSYAVEQ